MDFVSFGDYLAMPRPPVTWIVRDIVSVGGMALIYGRPKVGKSYASLGMGIAVSQGHRDWLGFPVETHGTVAYLQLDVGQVLWMNDYAIPVAPFVKDKTSLKIVDRDMAPFPFNLLTTGATALKAALAKLDPPPVLVVVDTIRRAHTGDENDSGHMQNVMSILCDAVYPSALLIVAHARKSNFNVPENVLDDNRGSSALTGAVDTIMKLSSNDPRKKGILLYEGRTALGKRHLRRDPSGLWLPEMDDVEIVEEVMASMPRASQNAQAEVLAARLGISHRTAIRRIQEITANQH